MGKKSLNLKNTFWFALLHVIDKDKNKTLDKAKSRRRIVFISNGIILQVYIVF